jgi:hypothetical protein
MTSMRARIGGTRARTQVLTAADRAGQSADRPITAAVDIARLSGFVLLGLPIPCCRSSIDVGTERLGDQGRH